MSKAEILKKLYLYKQNPNLVKEVSNAELADLVVLVMTAVQSIEDSMESKRVDVEKKYDTQAKQVLSKAEKDAQALLKEVTIEVNRLLDKGEQTLGQTATELEKRVAESIANLRNGNDGIVTEAEIERAAAMALGMLELPDFDALVTEAITSNSEAIRDALELLTGEDRYRVEIADVQGLEDALNRLSKLKGSSVGGIGKSQVYDFIRQAIVEGIITSGGASTFLDLTDTPSDYTGQGGKVVAVNAGETALEFIAANGVGTVTSVAVSGSDGIEVDSGSPITAAGTIALGLNKATTLTFLNVEDGADVTDAGNVGAVNAAAASKTSPVDADSFPIVNSESANAIGRVTFTNFKAFLKTYFDTLYAAALGADDNYVTDAEKTKLSNLSGTNTGDQTSIVGITGTKAQFDTAVTDGNFMYIGDAPTAHTHLLAAGATDVTASAAEVNILDGATVTTAELNILDGVTATASELNALDGITATVTELNYTDGVTSAIQTQLDSKLASSAYDDATAAETNTGTSTSKYVSPDGLAGSIFGEQKVNILVSDPGGSAITTGDGKAYVRVPSSLNGMDLVGVAASLSTVSSSGAVTVMVRRSRRSSATARTSADMLSTAITIDANEFDTVDAATAAVINTSNDDVATGDHIYIDIDGAGTGAKGLLVELIFRLA